MNIKILQNQNDKVKVEPPDPVPSLSQSVHGNDIKVEQTSISSNSENNLVDLFVGILADCSSLSTASIGESRAKKQHLSDPDIANIIMGRYTHQFSSKDFERTISSYKWIRIYLIAR